MRIYDIIEKKEHCRELTSGELHFFIDELVSGRLPDYQTTALLMAIFLNGMTPEETACLTMEMARSGDMIDLSGIEGIKVDKHSSGGIGDKTTLVVGPIVAACGGRMAKMSGRGLGTSGGTIDKLESIPGFNIALTEEEFIRCVNAVGMAVTGQTANVAPADKKLYALRDVTATVASIPLIASSIMSKKLASGADKLVLDVKMGSGAFMKDPESAVKLAETMVSIGELNGRETVAFITNMNRPLGANVGNLLEVQEVLETLEGNGPEDLKEVCLTLAGEMLCLAGMGSAEECRRKAEAALEDGSAAAAFRRFVENQGGDYEVIRNPEKYYATPACIPVCAERDGWMKILSAEEIGRACVVLGAGRETKESAIDYTAGIIFRKKAGDPVKKGEELCRVYAQDRAKLENALPVLKGAFEISGEEPAEEPLIYARISKADLEEA